MKYLDYRLNQGVSLKQLYSLSWSRSLPSSTRGLCSTCPLLGKSSLSLQLSMGKSISGVRCLYCQNPSMQKLIPYVQRFSRKIKLEVREEPELPGVTYVSQRKRVAWALDCWRSSRWVFV